jgi:hypothetical protein
VTTADSLGLTIRQVPQVGQASKVFCASLAVDEGRHGVLFGTHLALLPFIAVGAVRVSDFRVSESIRSDRFETGNDLLFSDL